MIWQKPCQLVFLDDGGWAKGRKNAIQTDSEMSAVRGAVRLSDDRRAVVEKRARLQHRSNCFHI